MVPNSIQQEVLIDAPIERVWSIVTEPEHISHWLSDSAEVDLRPGGELALTLGQFGTAIGTVVRVERPHVFSFRWVTPEPDRDKHARDGYFTLVEFRLRPDGDRTLLQVAESGFEHVNGTEQQNEQLAARHVTGWAAFLSRLTEHASGTTVSA
jgi:uncharacterized protein YndB with AHSA1/START domain